MHGFLGSYGKYCEYNLSPFKESTFVQRTLDEEPLHLTQVTQPKFLNDKYFVEKDGCFLATEGVLFEADTAEEAITRYKNGEKAFWQSWRGTFAGVFYDKKTNTLLVFNDHTGSKMLFYTRTEKGFFFASDPYILARATDAEAIDEHYLWQMLLYGYSPVNKTVYASIHRLGAGEYIRVCGEDTELNIYHRFDNTPNGLSPEENIERIDAAFRQAVTRAVRKNEQFGYTHFMPLSAGLDSRMTNRVAHEIATTPIHHITYSQSGYYDETIPRELAQYWQQPIHFTALDGGDCLKLLDATSRLTCGLVHYSGAAETLYGLPEEARAQCGLFLTGMLGDIVVGTAYTQLDDKQPYHIGEGAVIHGYNRQSQQSLPDNFTSLYTNREIYYLYVRGFRCANLGSPLVHQAFGESYSPFCDVDVLNAALAAPVQQRWRHRLYDQWILGRYPDMAQWKHNGTAVIGHRPLTFNLSGHVMPLKDIPKRTVWYILRKLHIHDFYKETEGRSMTPEDDWFAANDALREWSENYIQNHMTLLDSFPEIQQVAKTLSHGKAMEKMQVLSLLACLRQTSERS